MNRSFLLCALFALALAGCVRSLPVLDRTNISRCDGLAMTPAVAVDSRGTVHVAWIEQHAIHSVCYASRPLGGAWTEPIVLVLDSARFGLRLAIAIGPDDRVHLACALRSGGAVYLWRDLDGPWSAPETIPYRYGLRSQALAVDGGGRIHYCCNWTDWRSRTGGFYYVQRRPSGEWTNESYEWCEPDVMPQDERLCIGPDGTIHLAAAMWPADPGSPCSIAYLSRNEQSSSWSAPVWLTLTDTLFAGDAMYQADLGFAIDRAGWLCISWTGTTEPARGRYLLKPPGGNWSEATPLLADPQAMRLYSQGLMTGVDGDVYQPVCLGREGSAWVGYVRRAAGSTSWDEPLLFGPLERDAWVPNVAAVAPLPSGEACFIETRSDEVDLFRRDIWSAVGMPWNP